MTEPLEPPPDGPRANPSAVPFAAALAVVGVLAVLAFAFLRSDDEGRLVRPDRLDEAGEDVVRAVVSELPACDRLDRAQVDLEDDRILVELVAVEDGACDGAGAREVVAEITLPERVGDRSVVPGVGRTRLPCTGPAAAPRCAPAR